MGTQEPKAKTSNDAETWGWGKDAVLPLSDMIVEYFEDKPGQFYQRPRNQDRASHFREL